MRQQDIVTKRVNEYLGRPKDAHKAPIIIAEFTRENVRYYQDDAGGIHDANIYDQVFGTRKPSAILPAKKSNFSRRQRLR